MVECEAVEDSGENDDLYNLLNIEKRTDKSNISIKIEAIESTSDGERADAIQPETELTEVPSQSTTNTCNECGKNFNRTGNLKRHQEAVHGTVTQSAKNPKGNSKLEMWFGM